MCKFPQNIHNAYNMIVILKSGFSLFLSVSSKTTYNEHSLIFSAQGATGLTVNFTFCE